MSSPSAEAAKKPHKPKQIVIHIDRKPFKVEQEKLTGAELRALPDPDIGPEFDLWLEVPGGEDRRIENEESVNSRLAYYYCVTVIDLGVVISAAEDEVRGLDARVSVMTPGTPCLFCRGRIDPHRLREEQLPEVEREGLAEEGYARGLADPDPAVITYTTMTAAFAVDEMLQRLFGYGEETPSSEILIRPPRREVRRLAGAPVGAHFCVPDVLGRADREPPLGIGWS